MAFPTATPTPAEVHALWQDRISRDIRVSLPCEVVAYDATKQTVDLKPQIQDRFLDGNGQFQNEILPILTSCPIEWPGGGGMRITFPLQKGDTGRVTFCDRSLDLWYGLSAPADTAPIDLRRHHLSDGIFTPGLKVSGQVWTNVSKTVVQIGEDGQTADAVATAQRVLDQLQALADVFTNWTPVPNDGGAALKTLLTALMDGSPTWPAAPGSETTEILG